MTNLAYAASQHGERRPRRRHYLMTPPRHFAVEYAINPWMHPGSTSTRELALRQWQGLVDTYRRLGHRVDLVDPVRGPARHGVRRQRRPGHRERPPSRPGSPTRSARPSRRRTPAGSTAHGLGPVHLPVEVNEGEGDFLVVGDEILAGTGFRTSRAAHAEVAATHRPGGGLASSWSTRATTTWTRRSRCWTTTPSPTTRRRSPRWPRRLWPPCFPDAIIATAADAAVLGLNAVSDGRHVLLAAAATDLAAQLTAPRLRRRTGGAVRAAQGRRRGEVLHPRAAPTATARRARTWRWSMRRP